MKYILVVLCAAIAVGSSFAYVVGYGWETGEQAYLGSYGSIDTANSGFSTEVVRSGTKSLKIVENTPSKISSVYVGWVTGVNEGDVITASGWFYSDTTDVNVNPRGRLWGHYSADTDINAYDGGGNNSNNGYAGTVVWMQFTQNITVSADKLAVVIEARIYSDDAPANVLYFDDLRLTVPDGATVTLANGSVVVPEPATMAIMVLGGIFAVRKKR